jgi:hypothetical protein
VTSPIPLENEIDRIACELEAEVAGLRQFQQLLKKNPAMAERLRTVISAPGEAVKTNGRETKVVLSEKAGTPHYDLIRKFLLSKGNEPQKAPAIMAGTGLGRTQVSTILYKSRKNDFVAVRKDGRHPLWQLKNPVETPGH